MKAGESFQVLQLPGILKELRIELQSYRRAEDARTTTRCFLQHTKEGVSSGHSMRVHCTISPGTGQRCTCAQRNNGLFTFVSLACGALSVPRKNLGLPFVAAVNTACLCFSRFNTGRQYACGCRPPCNYPQITQIWQSCACMPLATSLSMRHAADQTSSSRLAHSCACKRHAASLLRATL